MNNPKREEEKARRERKIFADFVDAAGLVVDPDSIASERPPKPDISCIIDGEQHYFEMGEVTDEGLAARITEAVRTMRITGGFFSQDRPLLKLLESKLQKEYETNGNDLELVVYYDRQSAPPEGGLSESTQQKLHLLAKAMLLGRWSRVWIYDANGRVVLWTVDQSMV